MGVFSQFAANQFCTAQHIAPLVIAAKLHVAVVALEEVVEVVGLHNHIVELQEAKPLLHTLLIAVSPQHIVDRKAASYLPQQIHIVQFQRPIRIVDHLGFPFAKLNKPLHLLFKTGGIVVDVFPGKHRPHIRASGRIPNHGGGSTNQRNGPVTGHL